MHLNTAEALTVITCTILGVVGGFTAWVIRRVEASRARTERFVTERVTEVAQLLSGRLTVVDQHLTQQDQIVAAMRDRVARIEGKLGT